MTNKAPVAKALKVHRDLAGFDLRVNEFGEIVTSLSVDQLNAFLNKNGADKKLRELETVAAKETK